MTKKVEKVVIVGAGTAGLIAALMTKHHHPKADITVIRSKDIGVLGAGEGTTPIFTIFLEKIGIPIEDIYKHCRGNLKSAVSFVNWNGDGKTYHHSFDYPTAANPFFSKLFSEGGVIYQTGISKAVEDVCGSFWKPIDFVIEGKNSFFDKHVPYHNFAFHFDARLLAEYFERVAAERGIKFVDERYISTDLDEHDFITAINTDKGKHAADFVFDCSGFARLLVGGVYHKRNTWISYKDMLPLDRAMPFFFDHDNNVPTTTQAIAMKHGWMWKIPVNGRWGCGYVYSSKHCTDAEAKAEVEEYLGHAIDPPRVFEYNPGSYEKCVVKNCMAVGVSQTFVEPLEATNIHVTLQTLTEFFQRYRGLDTPLDGPTIKELNRTVNQSNTHILYFLYLHYELSKRTDTEFWRSFRDNTSCSQEYYDIKGQFFESHTIPSALQTFSLISWTIVADGMEALQNTSWYDIDPRLTPQNVQLWKQNAITRAKEEAAKCVPNQLVLDHFKAQI